MDTNSYVMFLVIGVALVAIDGQIVYRTGRAILSDVYQDPRAAKSMVQLVTVLFHLVVLGVLALVSTINVSTGNSTRDVVVKLGVVLLVLAAAHGATMSILSHIRDRRRDEQLADELVENRGNGMNSRPTSGGTISPAIDHQLPYTSSD